MASPALDVEQLIPKAGVEALDVLPRAAPLDVAVLAPTTAVRSCTTLATNSGPLSDRMCEVNMQGLVFRSPYFRATNML